MNSRILVVDDNSDIHEDIKKILCCADEITELDELESEIMGTIIDKKQIIPIIIDSALQGEQGIEMGLKAWKEGRPYALAFIDVRMPPGISGIETIKKIREFDKDLQFVIITAYSDYNWEEINTAINDSRGNLLILKKPFDSIEIRQLASALTEKWSVTRENQEKSRSLEELNAVLQSEIEERKDLEKKRRKLLFELDNRIKELNCIYELTQLIQKPEFAVDEILSRFVHSIPKAFKHPKTTCVRIRHEEKTYFSDNFMNGLKKLTAPILCHKEVVGEIDVFFIQSPVDSSGSDFSEENKNFLHLISNQIGKTIQRIMAEDQVKESEKKIRLIMDSTAEGIFGLDQNGFCTFCNGSCVNTLGYEKQSDFVGKHIHDMIHHTRIDGRAYGADECRILACCRSGKAFHSDQEMLWKNDGTGINVEYWAYPIFRNKDVIGSVVTFIDISDRILAEKEKQEFREKLRHSQKMEAIGTLAGGIAHDFNNILTPLLGYAELMKEELSSDNPMNDYIDQIIESAQRAKELVRHILAFSRQERHEPVPVKIQAITKEALKLLRATIPTNIEVCSRIDTNCGMVMADSTQIHQIIINLTTNAYHSMEKTSGTITISLEQVFLNHNSLRPDLPFGPYVCLTIADTGSGIKKEIMDKIFDPYFTTKEKGKGTGLGLSLVHGIVKSCSGDIIIDSEEGKGTRVAVFLPIISEVPKPNDKLLQSKKILGGSEKLLIVDDEPRIASVLKLTLTRLGYTVTAVTKSFEAMEMVAQNPRNFDLVITDMNMPMMTGLELSEKIKQIRPDMPVILCSGFNDTVNVENIKSLPIDAYLLKPVSRQDIALMIRKILDPI